VVLQEARSYALLMLCATLMTARCWFAREEFVARAAGYAAASVAGLLSSFSSCCWRRSMPPGGWRARRAFGANRCWPGCWS
jgi:hypothetical protein